ncbi:fam-a protein [Plasmodium chabaudi chabaudi]|uniref:Fam-a protein n=1 Tax=Plasmodium chabaudi chabaudi TaxID=31271 RepID=A0A1C6WJH7_PLACU|nr:fam-a protein [Plasmodium chabaudi chabaudi]
MNKFYIQIVLFLLSIFVCVNNKALATELGPKNSQKNSPKKLLKDPNKATTSEPTDHCLASEEIHEKKTDILCTNPKETKEAEELMKEAVEQLEHHATDMRNYKLYDDGRYPDPSLYKKKLENDTPVEKIEYDVYGFNKYDEIINDIWDPEHASPFNNGTVKIARVYNPNLVIIQQRYKKKTRSPQKYFYALATKVQISENTTIIAYTSANINDHNPSTEKYENTIVKKANSFKTDINSEEDIRQGKLKKTFVNLAGYQIQRHKNRVDVTYIESIDGHTSIKRRSCCGICMISYYANK